MTSRPTGILLDVDNTINRSDRSVSPRTIAAIKNVIASGIKVALCTGRQFSQVDGYNFFSPFSKDIVHVLASGAQLVRGDSEILFEHGIDHETVKIILDAANQNQVHFYVGHGDVAYFNNLDLQISSADKIWLSRRQILPADFSHLAFPLIVLRPLNQAILDCLETLAKNNKIIFKPMTSHSGTLYSDVVAYPITKADGAKRWCDYYRLNLEEIAMVGDGNNDIEVLQVVGQGIAMGNATSAVKKIAHQIIGATDNDGLAIWLESLL